LRMGSRSSSVFLLVMPYKIKAKAVFNHGIIIHGIISTD
jgi:hypothetical protein